MDDVSSQAENEFLAALPLEDHALLAPHLRDVDLVPGTRLYRSGEPIEDVYFPHVGIISLTVGADRGFAVETAMIGPEGLVGGSYGLGIGYMLSDATVQIAGRASRMDAPRFRDALAQSENLRECVARADAALLAQAQQSVACNALHSVEARICRWFLEIDERIDTERFGLTQEFLSQMLGVRRTTVTLVLGKLQASGAIECRRGRVRILDRGSLENGSCDCFSRIRNLSAKFAPMEHVPMMNEPASGAGAMWAAVAARRAS
jgi:CRP-like cAMP-binding protein